MSRVGKLAITVPSDVKVDINDSAGSITITGKLGTLTYNGLQSVIYTYENNNLVFKPLDSTPKSRSLWGTSRSIVNGMVKGLTDGFTKELEVKGVGYKANVKGNILTLSLGYCHDIKYIIPDDLKISVDKANNIKIDGISKQKVGQIAAELMSLRPFEPYKGKGVYLKDKPGRRKEGKKK